MIVLLCYSAEETGAAAEPSPSAESPLAGTTPSRPIPDSGKVYVHITNM